MNFRFFIALILLTCNGCIPVPFPRPVGGMNISGIVLDNATGLPLKNVAVTTTLKEGTSFTDSKGAFELSVGEYWRYFLTIPLGPYESLGYGKDARRFIGKLRFVQSGYIPFEQKVEFNLPLECRGACPPDWGGKLSTSRELSLEAVRLDKE